jgi:heme exporter protein C
MLLAMLVMALAFWMYCIAVTLVRVRVLMLEREGHTDWARRAVGAA